jgi:hypothetical protein
VLFIVLLSAPTSLVILSIVGILIYKYRKRIRKLHAYQRVQQYEIDDQLAEIETMRRAWIITADELKMKKLIDSGAYGEVCAYLVLH